MIQWTNVFEILLECCIYTTGTCIQLCTCVSQLDMYITKSSLCHCHSVSFQRRTTSSSLGRDTVPFHQTGILNYHIISEFFFFVFLFLFTFKLIYEFSSRKERFIQRWVEALSDPRVTHEIRSIWISYWAQVSLWAGVRAHTLIFRLSLAWMDDQLNYHTTKIASVFWLICFSNDLAIDSMICHCIIILGLMVTDKFCFGGYRLTGLWDRRLLLTSTWGQPCEKA